MFCDGGFMMFHPTRARRERRQKEMRRIGVVILLFAKKTVIMETSLGVRPCLKVKMNIRDVG